MKQQNNTLWQALKDSLKSVLQRDRHIYLPTLKRLCVALGALLVILLIAKYCNEDGRWTTNLGYAVIAVMFLLSLTAISHGIKLVKQQFDSKEEWKYTAGWGIPQPFLIKQTLTNDCFFQRPPTRNHTLCIDFLNNIYIKNKIKEYEH
jgi:hypothetical protein